MHNKESDLSRTGLEIVWENFEALKQYLATNGLEPIAENAWESLDEAGRKPFLQFLHRQVAMDAAEQRFQKLREAVRVPQGARTSQYDGLNHFADTAHFDRLPRSLQLYLSLLVDMRLGAGARCPTFNVLAFEEHYLEAHRQAAERTQAAQTEEVD